MKQHTSALFAERLREALVRNGTLEAVPAAGGQVRTSEAPAAPFVDRLRQALGQKS